MAKKRRLHYKDLDALRFFAFLPIFIFCALYLMSFMENKAIADATAVLDLLKRNSIDFFFFISAFLLTSHGLREVKYNKSFGIKKFYIRRLMRISPVLLLVLFFAFIIHPWIIRTLKLTQMNTPGFIDFIVKTPDQHIGLTGEQYVYLAVTWVIFMFIIFYLFWGLIMKFFLQNIKLVGYVLIAVGIAARIYHSLLNIPYEFNILTAGIAVGIGAITADIVRNEQRTVEMIKHYPKGSHILVYAVGTVVVITGYLFLGNTIAIAFIPLVTCAFYGYMAIEQTYGKNSVVKFRKSKILTRLGKISYGMIMYGPIILVMGITSIEAMELDLSSPMIQVGFIMVAFLLTWLVSDISYNFYERPILAFKKDFKRS